MTTTDEDQAKQERTAQAIRDVLVEDFDCDREQVNQAVKAGDPYGWGCGLAWISAEHGIWKLDYFSDPAGPIDVSEKLQDRGHDVFLEWINPGVLGCHEV